MPLPPRKWPVRSRRQGSWPAWASESVATAGVASWTAGACAEQPVPPPAELAPPTGERLAEKLGPARVSVLEVALDMRLTCSPCTPFDSC